MSVILKKEIISASEVVCHKYSQTTVDCDVIVPDVNPDILKILEVSGFVTVHEKSLRSNKVYIRGSVSMNVLYAPDGEVLNKVKSLSATQEFNHTIDAGNADGDACLLAEVEAESFNYSLINSRKVNLRCTIGMGIKLTGVNEFEIATDADGDTPVCTQCRSIRLCNNTMNAESRISVCEQLELPSGKPTIGEILKTTVFPQSLEFSLLENKAVAKGQLRICNLYTSADDGSIQFAEHTIPFSEVIDVEGAEEDMEGEIEYSVSDIYCEMRDDSDGEARIFGVDIGILALIKGLQIQEPSIICDAYSTSGEVSVSSKQQLIEQLIDSSTAQLTHKCTITRPDSMPEISQICDVSASASVDRISAENGDVTLYGSIKSNVLYISADDDLPLGSFCDVSQFTHTFHTQGADADTICEAKVFTEHISYTISGGDSIELRAVLGLNVRSFKNESVTHITDISVEECPEDKSVPNIIICFAQEGDSLWKIAKRYRTTVEALKMCNGLDGDEIKAGMQIKIYR